MIIDPSATTVLPPFVLANHHLLALLENHPFHQAISKDKMEEAVYLAYQPWQSRHPDHVFRSRWQLLCEKYHAKPGNWVAPMLKALGSGYLQFQHGKLHAVLDTYGEWQAVLSRISSLPVQAAAYAHSNGSNRFGTLIPTNTHGLCPLIYPYDPAVEDYIAREGLHETHLHLNGSTHAEICWQRALLNPRAELSDFCKKYDKNTQIQELCHSINPALNPAKLRQNLLLAKQIRCWLIAISDGRAERLAKQAERLAKQDKTCAPINIQQLLSGGSPFADDGRFYDAENKAIQIEMNWLLALLQRLTTTPDPLADRLLHLYLLLQNEYLQLTVQRQDMYGFDQFQKYTLTDLREPAEKDYHYRFRQMNGAIQQHSRTGWVEGRFAPKENIEKNSALLTSILGAYLCYLQTGKTNANTTYHNLSKILTGLEEQVPQLNRLGHHSHLKLTLVAHFVKLSWKHDKEKNYRHAALRLSLETRTNALCQTLEHWPLLRHWLCGIDAAANELHASPEVFAPFFRVCHRHGLTHKTYHAGEDFTHLISGIRQVADALVLLDIKDGDRIGHGTALGIDPKLWLASMPTKLVVRQGEWLLDLLIAWRYLRECPDSQQAAQKLASEVTRLATIIFAKPMTCEATDMLMQHRGLWPKFVFACLDKETPWFWQSASFSDAWREEARLVHQAKEEGADLTSLADWWQNANLWQRSEKLIEVDAKHLDEATLIRLQQRAMTDVQQRRVIIETLPTSNVRISQYQHHREHHSLRWMKVPGFAKPNDPDIMVSLGSDDPGIFSNDLSTDFYQLYAVLREHGVTDMAALGFLATINERGRQYRFHDRTLFG
ncbi:amidohydrolase family protein [Methylovulum psychrotolerans]|uniref:Adenosine deaminase n=1 Tax=Methylovulum psychrotolerans TaxID=1704499 RepID=A0A1Z4BXB1_9GAMM|nr:hypothetical protein [Methylovulum psychrotolerans]ASF45934.1 hypothetical protein CEK71_07495 [Methylovulum psychrotolerans]